MEELDFIRTTQYTMAAIWWCERCSFHRGGLNCSLKYKDRTIVLKIFNSFPAAALTFLLKFNGCGIPLSCHGRTNVQMVEDIATRCMIGRPPAQ